MRASEINLLQFIRRAPQFVIPIYQRHYSWGKVQWEQLWEDVLYAGQNEAIDTHFIGPIVYIANNVAMVARPEALSVIDGQQRLATSTLFIAALAQYFKEHELDELVDGFSARKLRNFYLVNPEEEGSDRYYKLILSPDDKDTLLALLGHGLMPQNAISLLQNGFRFFKEKIQQHSENLESICRGLAKLSIVEVALDRAHDKPQLIFESMNSTGLDLSQADLIRNYILMDLEQNEQKRIYKRYWRPMEEAFGSEAYVTHFDPFMRHYLTVKIGDIPNKGDVYTTFKRYVQNAHSEGLTIQDLAADIHRYATYYRAIALGAVEDINLKRAFNDLHKLNVGVAYPFLLKVYHDYEQKKC